MPTCSCCGEDRDRVATLACHDDVAVCRVCVDWLSGQLGAVDVTPTLPVADMDAAVAFYEAGGFDVERYDDGFAFVHWDDRSVFDLDLQPATDPATNGAGCYLIVPDVDVWHARLRAAGQPVTDPEAMPWGMYEFTLTDPSGNHLRIGASAAD